MFGIKSRGSIVGQVSGAQHEPVPSGPIVAKHLRPFLGGTPKVHKYYDRDEANSTAIFTAIDSPNPSWMTCSTVELHQTVNMLDDVDVRVELMAVSASADALLPNLVATAAFNVIKDGWLAAPGVPFPNLVREYYPTSTTPHLMWVEPFNLPRLSTTSIEGVGDVHWLLALPLSERELRFLESDGFDRLEERLDGIEYFDLWRDSAV